MFKIQEDFEAKTFLWLLLVVSAGFLWLLNSFFGPIFWAAALTIIFYPVQKKLFSKFNQKPNTQALLTLLLCLVIVVMPVVFLATSVINEAVSVYQKIESGDISIARYIDTFQTTFPKLKDLLEKAGIDFADVMKQSTGIVMNGGKFLAQHTLSAGQNAFKFLLSFCIMLYLTFFLLRDGENLVRLMVRALPMGDAREKLLFSKFAEVTRATIKGNLLVAMVQGALGGIIFALLGIPGAMLWGVIMAMMSMIPAVGAAIVWAPVAIYLIAIGQTTQGIILIVVGAGVIGLIDNLLRPILVGRDTKLPDYLVLLSTLGGISLFGISGFVIGPLIAALFVAFWGIFIREFHTEPPAEHLTKEETQQEQ